MVRREHTCWPTMLDTFNPWHVSACSIGPMARSTLDESILGEVCAVFEQTFYVRTENGLLCVGVGGMYNGPLTIVTNTPVTTSWRASGVQVGQHAVLRSRKMALGLGLVIAFGEATEWIPPRPAAILRCSCSPQETTAPRGRPEGSRGACVHCVCVWT